MSSELQKLESWKKELALIETLEELKLIGDSAEAYQELQRKQGMAKEKQDEVGEFILEVKERLGGWLNDHYPSNRGGFSIGAKIEPMPVTKKESALDRKLLKAKEETPALYEQIKDDIKASEDVLTAKAVCKEIRKRERKEEIEKQKDDIRQGVIALPKGVFDTIVIDPPWGYGREYDPDGSRVSNPYPEMNQAQLKELEISSAENSIMWLWTTHAFMMDARELLIYWGYEYKATLVWDKGKIGMGAWLRMQIEFCLLGIKGKPLWGVTDMRDIISEPRREHSRKPEAFYELIDKNFVGRKLDYFSRQVRPGWDVMGNDINKF